MAQVLHLTGPVLVGPDDVRAAGLGRRRSHHVCRADGRPRRHDGAGLGAAGPRRRAQPRRPGGARGRRRATRRAAGARRPRRRHAAPPRRRLARRHPVGAGARRPAQPDPGRPAHRPHPPLHPQLRLGGRARAARRPRPARGPRRGRLGQAGRRLDRPRHRRPLAVLAGRRARRGRRGGPRGGRAGDGALLRRGVAARLRRGRHRLRRARLRPPADETIALSPRRGSPSSRPWSTSPPFPQIAEPPPREVPRTTSATCSTCTSGATPRSRAAHDAGVPVYVGTDAGGSLPHGLVATEVAQLAHAGFTTSGRPGCRLLGCPPLARPARPRGGRGRRPRRLRRRPA